MALSAKDLFKNIGYGKRNAVSRPPNARIDRAFRKLIEQANASGDCIIPSVAGYYRPETPEEFREAEIYIRKERHRIRVISEKITRMSKNLERRESKLTAEIKAQEEKENSPASSVNWDTILGEDSSFPVQMVMRM